MPIVLLQIPSLCLASVAVLSTFTAAQPQRPKFYFPRQIKRQVYQNTTVSVSSQQGANDLGIPIQTPTTTPSASTPSAPEVVDQPAISPAYEPSKSPVLSSTSNPPPVVIIPPTASPPYEASKPTAASPTSDPPPAVILPPPVNPPYEASKPSAASSTSDAPAVILPTISPSGYAPDSTDAKPATANIPDVIISPTNTPSYEALKPNVAPTASKPAVAPTGNTPMAIVSPTFSPSYEASKPPAASSTSDAPAVILPTISPSGYAPDSTDAKPSTGNIPDVIILPTTSPSGYAPEPTAVKPSTGNIPNVVILPTTSPSGYAPEPTAVKPSTGSIPDVVILPTPTYPEGGPVSTSKSTSTEGITFGPGGILSESTSKRPSASVSESNLPTPTPTAYGILPTAGSVLNSALVPTAYSSQPVATAASISPYPPVRPEPSAGLGSIISSIFHSSTATTESTPIPTNTSKFPAGSVTYEPSTSPTNVPETTPTAPVNGTLSEPAAIPSTVPTTTAPPVYTVLPTTTNSRSALWLPSTIIAQSSSAFSYGQGAPAVPTGINSALPKVIANPNITAQPEDTTLIQLGFMFPLNYAFVVSNSMSSVQIFEYLPRGLACGLRLELSQVSMHSLVPLDTTAQLGFITTLALAYIPRNMVDTLTLDLHIPTSVLYNQEDPSVNTLMNYINPTIPLNPGNTIEGGAWTGTGSGSASTSSAPPRYITNIFGDTGEQNQSSGKTGATAGIAMAAIGGSAAYGAAMFLIARRYKKRKQNHRRSSSNMSSGGMTRSGSPALMGGAFMSGGRTSPGHDRNSRGSGRTGNSARTAQISAPMMAENSLGWN
ncbi:basic proline-rich protein [Diplocarpon rosae]|nr:basic proline-rich protein [Diplocarpon rosae]